MRTLIPDVRFAKLADITPEVLGSLRVEAVICDLDNTLAFPHSPEPFGEALIFLKRLKHAGIKFCVVSNNSKERTFEFCAKLGIPFVAGARKPLTCGVRRASRIMGIPKAHIAILGDQLFTDVLCARLFGVKALYVEPKMQEKDWFFKIKRSAEAHILNKTK